MLVEASKYADVRAQAGTSAHRVRRSDPPGAPALLIPRRKEIVDWDAWLWRELREGGLLREYLEREKALSARRLRGVARRMHGFRPNAKSEMRMVAAVPAREYHRWTKEDPDFWKDNANLKSFRRDNPDACIYL